MINAQLMPYGTTLADPNPLAAPSLVQQPGAAGGIPQIPTGEVKTEYGPTTEYKTPSSGTRAAMGEADTAGDAEIEAKRRQQEAAVKQEQMEAGSLAAQAQIAKKKQAEIEELQRRRNEWVAAEEARRHAELEDFKKSTKSASLFEDMTPTRRMLSALMVAGGQWAATMSGSNRNGAYEIFKDAEDNWRRTREAELKSRVEKMAAAGKSAKDMIDFFDKENDLIEKKFAARQDYALKALKSLKATVPTKGAELDEAIAKAEKDNAINTRNFVTNFDTTTREQGTSTQTSSGDKAGASSARAPASTDVKNFAMMQANAKLAERMMELQKEGHVPTPDQYREYMTNKNLVIARAEKEMKEGAFEVWKSKLGRGANVLPESVYPEGMTKQQREYIDIEQALSHQRGVQLFGQSAMASAEGRIEYMNPVTASPGDSPEDIKRKGAVLAEEFIAAGKAAEEVSKVGERERSFAARHPTAKAQAPAAPKPAPSNPAADHDFIAGKLNKNANALDAQRTAAFEQAEGWLKSGDSKLKAKAERVFKIIRDEMPKD